MSSYRIPADSIRIEHEVSRSRFIATLDHAATVAEARLCIASVRAEMPDANHHVYAFKIGYGSSVTEGVSDDGEPSGTAGPPVLAVLRGAEVGDVVVVVTRYFGGIKLGTGGLVRAYTDAARAALAAMTTIERVERRQLGLTFPYSLYERIKLTAAEYNASVDDQLFNADVTLFLTMPQDKVEAFSVAIRDLSAGRITPMLLD